MPSSPVNFFISPRRRLLRWSFIIIGILLMGFGFLRSLNSVSPHTLWVIDNSLSMAVTDISSPSGVMLSRLDLAKGIIASGSYIIPGDHAIMSVAYGAKLETPFTRDMFALRDIVAGINPVYQWWGTTLTTPIQTIEALYGSLSSLQIIWITDGEFSDSGSLQSWKLPQANITLVGVGTPSGWPILLGYNAEWKPRYKESNGSQVHSIRDDVSLRLASQSLPAKLFFIDSLSSEAIAQIYTQSIVKSSVSLWNILWVVFCLVGIMLPRYHYLRVFEKLPTWNKNP